MNKKIEVKIENDVKKYVFKPPLNLKTSKDLIKLLKKHHVDGKGGLYLEDVQDSLPNALVAIEVNK